MTLTVDRERAAACMVWPAEGAARAAAAAAWAARRGTRRTPGARMGKGGDDLPELRRRATTVGNSGLAATKDSPLAHLDPGHICVDGTVYELAGFVDEHPGGDSIGLFGGSDCTVQYHMIHPCHKTDGSALRRRMVAVEQLDGWSPQYSWGSPFELELKAAVLAAVPLASSFAPCLFFVRAAVLLGALAALEWRWATHGSSALLAVALGLHRLALQHQNPSINPFPELGEVKDVHLEVQALQ